MLRKIYFHAIIVIAVLSLIACSSSAKTTNLLELTDKENEIYSEFAIEHNDNILKGIELLSICKLYLHSGQIQDYENQYKFYIQEEKYLGWSKEKHLEDAKKSSQINKDLKKFENAKDIEILYNEDKTRTCLLV